VWENIQQVERKDMNEDKKFAGTVVWFNVKKGWGFIKQDHSDVDIFVHYSDIVSDGFRILKADQRVSYTTRLNNAGKPVAAEVLVIK
jgi:cold shock protein